MINESRRSQRRNVHESVIVIDTMTEQAIGRVGNISESGMLLVASAPLCEDALYQLRFEIIDRTGRVVAIDAGAHLIWLGSANTPGQSWAGLRFLTLEESQLAVLRQWISRPDARSYGQCVVTPHAAKSRDSERVRAMTAPDFQTLYADHLAMMKRRADEALARGGFDHLVVPSGTLHYQLFDDRDYPYAVNPQFKAWLPLTRVPNSWLVYTPGQRPKVIFHQPFDYWHVVPDAPSGWWVEHFDIHIIRTPDEALALLPKATDRCAIPGEPQSTLGNYAPNNPEPVVNYLEYHRSYKTPYEIALMREAQRLGVRGHRAAEAAFREGKSEFAIHMAYCSAVGQDLGELPYNNIVALNEHGAVLHYTELGRTAPAQARSFLIDAGASFHGYASDITRSYAFDKSSEFQSMIDAVDAAQIGMCQGVRAGVDYKQLHVDAHLNLMTILKDFGVIKVSPEAALETGVSAAFFPHGLGHPIGLQVHDVAGFAESDRGGKIARPAGHPYLRMTRVLEPGMVVTIEPGLYFIDMLLDEVKKNGHAASVDWARVEAFRPYGGIRIEDEVMCTEGDAVNLTRPAFAAAA